MATVAAVRSHFATLGKQALIYGLSGAGLQLVGLVTLPVYARYFTAAQYGVLELAMVGFAALIVAVDAGLGSAMQRNYFEVPEDDPRERRLVASTATVGSVAIAVVLAVPMILARRPIAGWLFHDAGRASIVTLVSLSVPAGTAAIFFRDVLRVRFRPGHFAVSSALAGVLAAAVGVVGVVAFGGGAPVVIAGLLAGQAVAALYGWAVARRDMVLGFSRRQLRSLLAFGLPLVPATASMWAMSFVDRIVLSQLDGLAATGQYAVGTRFASVLMLVSGAFGTAYVPFMFSLHSADPEHEREFRGRLLTYVAAGLVSLGVVLALAAREIASVIAPGYDDAFKVVGIFCLGVAAFGLTPITSAGISIARRTHYAARYTVAVVVVNVALCFALIPPLGLVGAALATALGYGLLAVAYVRRSQQLAPAAFELGKVLRVFALGIAVMPAGLLTVRPEALELALKAGALAVFVGGLWALGVIGEAESAELRRLAVTLRTRRSAAA